jgi:hypothetical protein
MSLLCFLLINRQFFSFIDTITAAQLSSKNRFHKRPRVSNVTIFGQIRRYPEVKIEKSINSLQESLDYLRVCIKYQVFDLEATRRENEYLKKLLEENNESE